MMTATTYELIHAPDSPAVFKCLFCGGQSSDPDSIQRLHWVHCSWFHEPLDENRVNLFHHLQAAVEQVQGALDIAEALSDDSDRNQPPEGCATRAQTVSLTRLSPIGLPKS
jgi:hypothetical protein